MIPLQLEITNFLSYRKTAVLDFRGIHLACISGANGAGKSSILDAMTWVIFGQSRSKSDDDLVNRLSALDDKGMEVRLIFKLEEAVYRIMRRKKAGKRLVLELQLATNPDEETFAKLKWKTLSEAKVRETQAAIETLLRMNYDTFINASFLLQGKADEFTTKTANRRKEILADLLGVSQWDQYRERATARRKQEEVNLQLLDGRLADIEQELTEEDERAARLEAIQAEQTALRAELTAKETVLNQMRLTQAAVSQQKQLVENLAGNLLRAQRDLDNLTQTEARRQAERAEHEAILAEADEIEAAFGALQEAEKSLAAWQTKGEENGRLEQQKRPHLLTIERTKSRLTQEQTALHKQQAEAEAAQSERNGVTTRLEAAQAKIGELGEQLSGLAEQETAYQAAREARQKLTLERESWQKELRQLRARQQEMGKLEKEQTAVSNSVAQAEQRLADLQSETEKMAQAQRRQEAIGLEQAQLEQQQPPLMEKMTQLKEERVKPLEQQEGGDCPVCGQTLTAEHKVRVLEEVRAEGKALADTYRANRNRLAALADEAKEVTAVLSGEKWLKAQQEAAQKQQQSSQTRLGVIQAELEKWASEKTKLTELEKKLAEDEELQRLEKEVAELETAVRQKSELERQRRGEEQSAAAAEARLGTIEGLIVQWQQEGAARLAEVTTQLADESFEAAAREALAELEKAQTAVGYDAASHEATRTQRAELAEAGARRQALLEAKAAVKPLEATLTDLAQQIGAQRESVDELTTQHEAAKLELATLSAAVGDLASVEREVFDLRERGVQLNQRVGAAQQRLTVLDDLRDQREKLTEDRAVQTQLIRRLKVLEKACGRDGVQALLIEQALPDIEMRANDLLERLTGGTMRVRFETQRKLKTSNRMRETLDITIRDQAGERPYENFSGGEQFRVNFAIRLALSQVLAKRAGARLQTLVVDEGFGSQDPNGRQRLVEAINTIQNDFARILIITHVEALRDAFPNRIEVEKQLAGSTITIV